MRLTHLLWIACRYLTAQKDSYRTAIEAVKHLLEDIERLQFVDEQWVFLLVASVLYGLLEFVQLAQVLFPLVVNHEEQHTFLKLAHNFAALGLVSGFEINSHVVRTFAVSDWNEDILVHSTTLLINVLDDRVCYFLQGIHATFEGLHCLLSQFICQHILFGCAELLLGKWHFHSKDLHHIHLQSLIVHHLASISKHRSGSIVNHIGDIHTYALAHESVVAFRIDDITLLVHHIIILNEAFTNTKVILFYLLLCTLNGV